MLDATATAQPTQSDFADNAPESSHGIAPVVMGAEQAKVESNAPEETAPDSSSANPVTSLPQVAAVAAAPSGAELGAAQTLVDANQWRAAVIAEYDAAVRASGAAVAAAPGGVPQHRPPPYALVGGFESSFDDEDMDDPAAAYDFSNGGQLSEASSRHSSGRISERAPADAVEAEAEEGEEEEYEEEEAGAYGQAMPYDMGAHYDAAGYGAALQPHYAAAAAHAAAAAAAAAAGGGVLATSGRAQKRAWTQEEDAIILDGVKTFGHKWSKITERLPVPRTDDSVRNRWQRLLRKQEKPRFQARRTDGDGPPAVEEAGVDDGGGGGGEDASGLRHGDMWTAEEDEMIDRGVRLEGLRWREIAARLPGRTESGCRNRWVRTQERQLAAAGMPVRGAAEVFAALRAASLMPAKRQRVDTGARAHNPPPVAADVAARPPSAYV